jgi:hypothetical protein
MGEKFQFEAYTTKLDAAINLINFAKNQPDLDTLNKNIQTTLIYSLWGWVDALNNKFTTMYPDIDIDSLLFVTDEEFNNYISDILEPVEAKLIENNRVYFGSKAKEMSYYDIRHKILYPDIIKILQGETSTWFTIEPLTYLINNEDNVGEYPLGLYMGLYAVEDFLDQPICKVASKINLNVLILLNMAGKTRAVTEVMDTRKRKISFDNLVLEVQ